MDVETLISTANSLVSGSKGLLAMDESNTTCNKRFAKIGIQQTEDARRDWRELIATTNGLAKYISGAILYDETIYQNGKNGKPILRTLVEAGIIPGVKVDTGAKPMAGFTGEKITEGLDRLRERLYAYHHMGIRFAKWRAVIRISDTTPTSACVEANAHALARYAALCQEAGLVPVIEPEVLMEGAHNLQQCSVVTKEVLQDVFGQLYKHKVILEGIIIKPNMITCGLQSQNQASINEVANATIQCLLQSVPAAVAGIAFLSGGQPGQLASAHLNAMHRGQQSKLPWPLTFSFSRAIQQPALDIWQGRQENVKAAQHALYHRAKCDVAARRGEYTEAMDSVWI